VKTICEDSPVVFEIVVGAIKRQKLGRNDPCPCGSGRRFQEVLHALRAVRRLPARTLLSAESSAGEASPAVFIASCERIRAHA